jgi:hypothetical protein
MNMLRLLGAVFASLLLAGPALAQTSSALTPDVVEGFIVSLRDLQEVGKKYDAEGPMNPNMSLDEGMERAAAPFSAAIAQMQGHEAYGEMLAAIERHGFSDVQQWALTGDRIMKAFVANSMEAETPQMDAQMKQALEQIENSNMSAAQKETMLQMMRSSTQMMSAYTDVPAADKAAVAPFMSTIESLGQQ